MLHSKRIIHCSCANALYPPRAIQWDKCNLTLFNIFQIWRFFL